MKFFVRMFLMAITMIAFIASEAVAQTATPTLEQGEIALETGLLSPEELTTTMCGKKWRWSDSSYENEWYDCDGGIYSSQLKDKKWGKWEVDLEGGICMDYGQYGRYCYRSVRKIAEGEYFFKAQSGGTDFTGEQL